MFIYFYAATYFITDFFRSVSPLIHLAILLSIVVLGGLAQLIINLCRYKNVFRFLSFKKFGKKFGKITSFNKRQFARQFATKFDKKIRKEMKLFLEEDKNFKGSLVNDMIEKEIFRKKSKSKFFLKICAVYILLTTVLMLCLEVEWILISSIILFQFFVLGAFLFINRLIETALAILDEYYAIKLEAVLAENIRFGCEVHQNAVDFSKLDTPLEVIESNSFGKLFESVKNFLATKPNSSIVKLVSDSVKQLGNNYVFSKDEKLSYDFAIESLENYC